METIKLSWQDLEILTQKLINKLSQEKFDSVLCISSGGLILGKLIADSLKMPLSVITAESYDKGTRTNFPIRLGQVSTIRPLKGKILLIDDLVESGQTLQVISQELLKNPEIKEVKTAVLYDKPQSPFRPHFFVEITSKWVLFPYSKIEDKNLK